MTRRTEKSRPRSAARNPPTPSPAPHRRGGLIPLDTRRIRERALHEYRQAARQLAQLQGHLQRYHTRDVPGFRAWIHRTFGQELTRQRELLQAIEEKRALLIEVEQWIVERGLSEAQAYRHVLWRRANPAEAEAEDRRFEERARQASERDARHGESGPGAEEQADDWPEDSDPFADPDFDDISDDEWDDFSDFMEASTGQRPPPRRPSRAELPREDESAKSLYRQIVRRLHPDHHGHMSAAHAELWHAAQAAYRRRDVVALQGILARCEGGGAPHSESPVSVVRHLVRELRKAIQAVRRETRGFRKEPAWDYERRLRDPRFTARMAAEVDSAQRSLEWTLREVDREIARLERKAVPRPRRPRPSTSVQDELPF